MIIRKNKVFAFFTVFTAILYFSQMLCYASDSNYPFFDIYVSHQEDISNNSNMSYITYPDGAKDYFNFAAGEGKNILMVNGVNIPKAEIIIENGYSLIPIRIVSENMGYDVKWNNQTKEITISNNENSIIFTLNSSVALHNNNALNINTIPRIINGLSYIPLRDFGELFNCQVDYYTTTAFGNRFPIISLDNNKSVYISEEEAVSTVNKIVDDNIKKLEVYDYYNFNNYVTDIYVKGRLGRYYIINIFPEFEDNIFIVDSTNGEIYSSYITWNGMFIGKDEELSVLSTNVLVG